MKKLLIASILLIGFQSSINGGNIWSMLTKAASQKTNDDPVVKIKQELNSYLETLDLKAFTSKDLLGNYIQDLLNKNVREDSKNFPFLTGLINQPDFESDKNIGLREQIIQSVNDVAEEFVNKKSVELNLAN